MSSYVFILLTRENYCKNKMILNSGSAIWVINHGWAPTVKVLVETENHLHMPLPLGPVDYFPISNFQFPLPLDCQISIAIGNNHQHFHCHWIAKREPIPSNTNRSWRQSRWTIIHICPSLIISNRINHITDDMGRLPIAQHYCPSL